jgi:hypothetical protein
MHASIQYVRQADILVQEVAVLTWLLTVPDPSCVPGSSTLAMWGVVRTSRMTNWSSSMTVGTSAWTRKGQTTLRLSSHLNATRAQYALCLLFVCLDTLAACAYICFAVYTKWPPLWSSGQSSWLQIRRPRFDSRHYQKESSGSATGCTQPREYNWGATW